MIHPAWLLVLAILQPVALLYAVSFGFKTGYAAYKGDKPPEIQFPKVIPQKDEWESAPGPISPTRQKRERSARVPEE